MQRLAYIHIIQALPRALRSSSRTCSIFGFFVSTQAMALNECPLQYIAGKDVHSDKEASHFLCPKSLRLPHWDDIGMNLFQLLALICFDRQMMSMSNVCYCLLLLLGIEINEIIFHYFPFFVPRYVCSAIFCVLRFLDSLCFSSWHVSKILSPEQMAMKLSSTLDRWVFSIVFMCFQ